MEPAVITAGPSFTRMGTDIDTGNRIIVTTLQAAVGIINKLEHGAIRMNPQMIVIGLFIDESDKCLLYMP